MDAGNIKVTVPEFGVQSDDFLKGFEEGSLRGIHAACEEAGREIIFYRSALVSILNVAESESANFTRAGIAEAAKAALEKHTFVPIVDLLARRKD